MKEEKEKAIETLSINMNSNISELFLYETSDAGRINIMITTNSESPAAFFKYLLGLPGLPFPGYLTLLKKVIEAEPC